MGIRIHGTKWLSRNDIDKIHDYSLEVLWERGIRIQHPKALSLLADAGAQIDDKTKMVHLPPKLVEGCVQNVPREFVLGALTPEWDLRVGSDSGPFVRSSGGAEGYFDLRTRVYRRTTLADLKEWTRLLDGLPNVTICGGFSPTDASGQFRDVLVVKTMMENSGKHLFLNPSNYRDLKAIIDMGLVIRGDKNALKDRPPITCLTSVTSPADVLDYCVDILLLSGEYGLPVEVNSTPIMGGTSPVTLAGCVLQANLEILALVVISQLANPGAPLIHRGITMGMDMGSGMGLSGSIESAIAQAALTQVAREKYQMPVTAFGMTTDALIADGESQIERTAQSLLAALADASILAGAGTLESFYCVDPVQLTIDDEILGFVFRALRGLQVDEETLAKDLIKNMGPGGNYLAEEHTIQHHRSEHWRPTCFNRYSRADWKLNGAKEMERLAQERAINILRDRPERVLEKHVQKELDNIYEALVAGRL